MSEYISDDRDMPRFRVNRDVMVDPDILALERERVFERSWLYLGHTTELGKPNDFIARTLLGRPLIFARDSQGEIRVWINSCPHRGAMLCREPAGNARFMTCMYHGWSFTSSGQMVSMPSDSSYGPNYQRPGLASPPRVDSYRGFVFVSFDPDVVDLMTYLAGSTEYLDLVCDQSLTEMQVLKGTHEYSVRANWKLLVENSYDGYHAVTTHQRYFEMVVAARGRIDPGAIGESVAVDLGNGHSAIAGAPTTGGLFGRPLSTDGDRERDARLARFRERYGDAWVNRMMGSRNLVIFPNLIVIDLVMGVLIRRIEPISPDYMEVTSWHLAPEDESAELRAQRLDNFLTFWGPGGLATPDDVEALETCQRGYGAVKELRWSDISRGMHTPTASGNDELQMRVWWRRWNEIMTGEKLPAEAHALPAEVFRGLRTPPLTSTV